MVESDILSEAGASPLELAACGVARDLRFKCKTPVERLAMLKASVGALCHPLINAASRERVTAELLDVARDAGLVDAIGEGSVRVAIASAMRDVGIIPEQADLAALPLSIEAWMARNLPEPDPLLGDWLTTTSRALLVAPTGLGKTNFAMHIGMTVAAGLDFLHWRGHRPRRVLYIDGEMSRRLLKKRLAEAAERLDAKPDGFLALSHEDIDGFAPLNTPEGQACIEQVIAHVGGIDLAMFDSVMCLTAGDMKDEESWAQTMPWVRSLTRQSIGQLWVHHTGHDESRGYGTKTREWQLDTVAVMESIKRDDADVSFRLEFKKARERTPDTRADFRPVKVWLSDDWNWSSDDGSAQRVNRKLSDRDRLALDALTDCSLNHGSPPPTLFGLPAGLSAVTLDQWRTELFARGVLDREASNPREDYRRIRSRLAARKLIGERDGLVWRSA